MLQKLLLKVILLSCLSFAASTIFYSWNPPYWDKDTLIGSNALAFALTLSTLIAYFITYASEYHFKKNILLPLLSIIFTFFNILLFIGLVIIFLIVLFDNWSPLLSIPHLYASLHIYSQTLNIPNQAKESLTAPNPNLLDDDLLL